MQIMQNIKTYSSLSLAKQGDLLVEPREECTNYIIFLQNNQVFNIKKYNLLYLQMCHIRFHY